MNIIIGATGQLGHALATEHEAQGLPWVGTSRSGPVDHKYQVDMANTSEAVAMLDMLGKIYDHDLAVYYAAGITNVDWCEENRHRARLVDAGHLVALVWGCQGPLRLLQHRLRLWGTWRPTPGGRQTRADQ